MAHAHTDTMDTRKLLKPVVVERPARGREMKTQDFAEEDAAEEGAKRRETEMFHEGYVGGKKFLVPDSNLEAMADMINLKMRRMETSKYVSDSDALKTDDVEDNYLKKKESLFKKLESLADAGDDDYDESDDDEEEEEEGKATEEEKLEELPSSSEEEEVDEGEEMVEEEEDEDKDKLETDDTTLEKEEETAEEEEESEYEEEESVEGEEEDKDKLGKDENNLEKDKESADEEEEEEDKDKLGKDDSNLEKKGESADEEEEESVDEKEDEKAGNLTDLMQDLSKEDEDKSATEGEAVVDDADGLVPVYYHDPNVKRFLISGHFRSNRKPIFIIQQYEGPSVFKHKDPEFFSHKSEKDVDIFICGEFFKESILEEDRYKQPVSLKTKPRKVVVDWRSRIYEEKFSDVFIGAEVDVEFSGSFIKHSLSALHTPLLSIVLRKGTAFNTGGTGPAIYVMRPIVENLFEKEKAWRNTRRERSEGIRRRGEYEVQGGRTRTGFEYPEGSRVSGPMTVYVSHPETFSPWQRRSTGDERSSHPTSVRKRDTLRETLVLPETSRRSGPGGSREHGKAGVDLTTTSARREHIRRSLSREETPSEILEAFVKTEREKRRARRQKEREKVTMSSILSQLFLSK